MNTSSSKSKLTKFIPILIILFILAGIVDKAMHSIVGTHSFNVGSFIETFIPEDNYEEDPIYEDAMECYAEKILYEFEDDYTLAKETYEFQYVLLHGVISNIVSNEDEEYFYEVSIDESRYKILIPIYDYYDDEFADEYKYDNIGVDFTYYGEVYFDEEHDDIIYIHNGNFK